MSHVFFMQNSHALPQSPFMLTVDRDAEMQVVNHYYWNGRAKILKLIYNIKII